MTPPRRVRPGDVVELSRRTVFRQLMLLPTAKAKQLFLYVLGVVAARYNVSVIAAVVVFSHYHAHIRDNDGRLPDFMRDFDSLIARAMNSYLGKDDAFWSADGYTPLLPVSDLAYRERLDYLLTNALESNLVNRLADYPHIVLSPDDVEKDIVVDRPDFFFGKRTELPEQVTLRFVKPPAFDHLTVDQYKQYLRDRIAELEAEHRRRRREEEPPSWGDVAC